MTHQAAFGRWITRFSGQGCLFGTEPNRFLAAQRDRLPRQGLALTIADGEGRNGVWLARQGLAVTAVEHAPAAIATARRLAERQWVSLDIVHADVAGWDWGPPASTWSRASSSSSPRRRCGQCCSGTCRRRCSPAACC